MTDKIAIIKYYQTELDQFFNKEPYPEKIFDFKSEYRIGQVSISPESMEISGTINDRDKIPVEVLDAFERHLWYAKHSISYVSLVKVPVNGLDTFAICIDGYIDDGWDNGGHFLEIYDELGQLVRSARDLNPDDQGAWLDRPIRGNDFNTPSPPWPNEI